MTQIKRTALLISTDPMSVIATVATLVVFAFLLVVLVGFI